MSARTFKDNFGDEIVVDITEDGDALALWDAADDAITWHLPPEDALALAQYIIARVVTDL